MHPIVQSLARGDRRSTGRADQVAKQIAGSPALFGVVFRAMLDDDPVVRMRAADAVEKASRGRPDLLQPHKRALLTRIAAIDQQEVRWHWAQMVPRLALSKTERARAITVLRRVLREESRIAQVMAMQALADFVQQDPSLRPAVIHTIWTHMEQGGPAVKARGRKLMRELNRQFGPVRNIK